MGSEPKDTQFRSDILRERFEQIFPTLTPAEIERLRRFGSVRRYNDGDKLFEAGSVAPGMFIVLSGDVSITQRDGLGHVTPIITQGPGQFLAEVAQLSKGVALVDGRAEGAVETLLIPTEGLRNLLIAEAEMGERIMRALILRRVALIEAAASGAVLIGSPNSGAVARLQNFLNRNGYPNHVLDPETDLEAGAIVQQYVTTPADLPLAVCPNGTVLRNPSESELARVLGMVNLADRSVLFDVAIIGSGPAGLATAVYGASEGLSMAVLDRRAFGGQAGASARIENYLGFPTGITGQALAGRAFVQAQKFGAEIMIPTEVKRLDCGRDDGTFALDLGGGETIRARAIVIASGARYRRLPLGNLHDFEGNGVWYWASPIEARLSANEHVVLVGGGNSAGQAAVFLAGFASKVTMMVRGNGLADTMSRYLIDRITSTPNIELHPHTEISALTGQPGIGLERVTWRNRKSGEETTADVRNVFLFIGADPATDWLKDCGVELDRGGFVITGQQCSQSQVENPLQSSIPGVFAVGDVRSGSVKRVGGAIGEGAQVVAALHRYLADTQAAISAPAS